MKNTYFRISKAALTGIMTTVLISGFANATESDVELRSTHRQQKETSSVQEKETSWNDAEWFVPLDANALHKLIRTAEEAAAHLRAKRGK